jgi:hypothetical protein
MGCALEPPVLWHLPGKFDLSQPPPGNAAASPKRLYDTTDSGKGNYLT